MLRSQFTFAGFNFNNPARIRSEMSNYAWQLQVHCLSGNSPFAHRLLKKLPSLRETLVCLEKGEGYLSR